MKVAWAAQKRLMRSVFDLRLKKVDDCLLTADLLHLEGPRQNLCRLITAERIEWLVYVIFW